MCLLLKNTIHFIPYNAPNKEYQIKATKLVEISYIDTERLFLYLTHDYKVGLSGLVTQNDYLCI